MTTYLQTDIDPNFSVYHLVNRVAQESTLLNNRRSMSLISREIENATLVDGARTHVFASFQLMSRFLPQQNRYRRLAEYGNMIYVFGIPDTDKLPTVKGIHYVPITAKHQLAKEWFLVSYGQDYYSALVTEEVSHFTDPDEKRRFKGIWSFDLNMVSTLHEWLCGVVGISPQVAMSYEGDINYQQQIKLMSNTIGRIVAEMQ